MTQLQEFSDIAKWMRNVDPRVYDQFIKLLQAYAQDLTVAVTDATPGEIFVAQGRAQIARKFAQLFTEIREPKKPTP